MMTMVFNTRSGRNRSFILQPVIQAWPLTTVILWAKMHPLTIVGRIRLLQQFPLLEGKGELETELSIKEWIMDFI